MISSKTDYTVPGISKTERSINMPPAMTLRDYFAAQAMRAVNWFGDERDDEAADGCYQIAAAMIRARDRAVK